MAANSEAALRAAMPPIFSDKYQGTEIQGSVMAGRMILRRLLAFAFSGFVSVVAAVAQPTEPRVAIQKIDPPNWWIEMPAPMLLVRGEGLSGARFSLSDPGLRIGKTVISDNGHWAQLWLTKTAGQPEVVTIRASRGGESAEAKYSFGARKPASAGFAGFSATDVMYLIMTDRFADGDLKNDGPHAEDAATSAAATAERAKPRGWHGGDYRGIERAWIICSGWA